METYNEIAEGGIELGCSAIDSVDCFAPFCDANCKLIGKGGRVLTSIGSAYIPMATACQLTKIELAYMTQVYNNKKYIHKRRIRPIEE